MNAVSVRDVVKTYGDVKAVDGISFDVPEGSFFAFLGSNGAGKSTTISMICSLCKPDHGTIEVFGRNVSDVSVRKDIGVVFQDPMLDGPMTVRENLEVRASMYGLADICGAVESAISCTGCSEFADRKYATLSGGQRRRADIARALVHGPRLLILDEPTSGLDPHTRMVIWDTILSLNRGRGMTILLTTHYMEEAAGADDVVVIDHGSVVAHGTPEELKEEFSSDRLVIVPKDASSLKLRLECASIQYTVSRDVFTIQLGSTSEAIPLIDMLKEDIASFEVRMGTLDEAFIAITGGESG